ncbi:hypothetical protein B0T26DRAFT_648000 [Lasiosphaeria miniovina]|uniref:Galactosyl transferase GMA12/MNN10 family protein n=1 Tax=Lasiosphaeria miniovina TaxID=1954250 RepID=A0AA40AJ89_9PEZI|nr:uncharacterized protein B0T26DRAFT_648000 [Lasiosphaeria miniovina]KAK0716891.1 hypothetical protein B0T26DRAFT_648000 [Lasiosphaeria miniovina]
MFHRQRPARVALVLAVLFILWYGLANFSAARIADDSFPGGPWKPLKGTTSKSRRSSIGKITVAANSLNSDVIHRAMLTHERHNNVHGYVHHIAYNEAVSSLIENDRLHRPKGAWTKPAYIMSILVAELQKPDEERLKWVFWFDADTAIMNFQTPLHTFLPPGDLNGIENVDLLIASNWDGLNSGVFALRVSPWSVSFMSAVLAYPIYEPAKLAKNKFRDQSAIQYILEDKASPLAATPMKSKDHWVQVPMRWFNALPVNNAFYKNGTWLFGKNMTKEQFDDGTENVFDDGHGGKLNAWKIMQGDLAVHFAGSSNVRDSWMTPWLDRAEAGLPAWNNATAWIAMSDSIRDFWVKTDDEMAALRTKSADEETKKEKEKKEKEKLEKEKARKDKEAKEQKDKDDKARKEKEKLDKAAQEKDKQQKELQQQELREQQRKQKAEDELLATDDKPKHSAGKVLLVDTTKFDKGGQAPTLAPTTSVALGQAPSVSLPTAAAATTGGKDGGNNL